MCFHLLYTVFSAQTVIVCISLGNGFQEATVRFIQSGASRTALFSVTFSGLIEQFDAHLMLTIIFNYYFSVMENVAQKAKKKLKCWMFLNFVDSLAPGAHLTLECKEDQRPNLPLW